MRKLLILIVVIGAIWSWQTGRLPFLNSAGAFDEAGNPLVWIFTIKNCGKACVMGRQNLDRRRVKYEEKLIDPSDSNDPTVALWKSVGRGGFPLIIAGNETIKGSGSTAMIVNLLTSNFGDAYLTNAEKSLFKNHFDKNGTPKIVMYGADWCPYCKKLRTELNDNNVEFTEIDVDKSANKSRIVSTLEIDGYPAVWVGYTRVNGTNLKAINKVLGQYKTFSL